MTKTKLATAVTPLRQVMSKSIQRAIREHGPSELLSPKSPLDLRMSPALRRFATSFKASDTELSEESGIGVEIIKRNNRRSSLELKNPLETVYETVNGHDSMLESASETHRNDCKTNNLPTSHFSQHQDASDEATPLTSGRKYNASNKVYDDAIAEVWYTPSENFDKAVPKSEVNMPYARSKVITTHLLSILLRQIYTPVLKSSNRTNKRIAIQQCDDSTRENAEVGKQTQETNHTPPKSSRLWSLVSSVFRFVPFKTAEEPVDQNEMSSTDSDSSPFVIKRCASFAGKIKCFFRRRVCRSKSLIALCDWQAFCERLCYHHRSWKWTTRSRRNDAEPARSMAQWTISPRTPIIVTSEDARQFNAWKTLHDHSIACNKSMEKRPNPLDL